MILRSADGTVYKVHFRHWLPCQPVHVKGKGLCRAVNVFKGSREGALGLVFLQAFAKRPKTVCYLHAGDCRGPWQLCVDQEHRAATPHLAPIGGAITFGEARCSPRDVFRKTEGRRIALERAAAAYFNNDLVKVYELVLDYERQLQRSRERAKVNS